MVGDLISPCKTEAAIAFSRKRDRFYCNRPQSDRGLLLLWCDAQRLQSQQFNIQNMGSLEALFQ
jgi:hypothetical protein